MLKEVLNKKEPRKMPEIQAEYGNLVQKAGQIQYQVHVLNKDLEMLNSALRDLNMEAAASQEAEKASKPSESEKKSNEA